MNYYNSIERVRKEGEANQQLKQGSIDATVDFEIVIEFALISFLRSSGIKSLESEFSVL